MYYHLHAHCKLVAGKARGAIYDFAAGKVYSINRSAVRLIEYCEQNSCADPRAAFRTTQLHFFDALTKKNLGGFYLEKPADSALRYPPVPKPRLEFAWLELTAECNNRCLHCYTNSAPEKKDRAALPPERWRSLIGELRAAGASCLQLIGGEPLLYPHWRQLIEAAAAERYAGIELFTNATLLDDDSLDFLDAHRVQIATTLYAAQAELHDRITQQPGSFAMTLRAIEKIRRRRMPLRIASILMKANENEAENLRKFCEQLGIETQPPDIVRPSGRGADRALQPASEKKTPLLPPFFTSEAEFARARSYHPCLTGKLAVLPNGDVLPCVFARTRWLGNIRHTPLSAVLRGEKLQSCWKTGKDKIAKCKDCEYRYACPDCRPGAQGMDESGDWLAAPPECAYLPQQGVWPAEPSNHR